MIFFSLDILPKLLLYTFQVVSLYQCMLSTIGRVIDIGSYLAFAGKLYSPVRTSECFVFSIF